MADVKGPVGLLESELTDRPAETEEQAAERELWREVKQLAADVAHPEGACALVRMINDRLNQPAHWRSLCAECDGRV